MKVDDKEYPTTARDVGIMAVVYVAIGFFLYIGFGIAKLIFAAL